MPNQSLLSACVLLRLKLWRATDQHRGKWHLQSEGAVMLTARRGTDFVHVLNGMFFFPEFTDVDWWRMSSHLWRGFQSSGKGVPWAVEIEASENFPRLLGPSYKVSSSLISKKSLLPESEDSGLTGDNSKSLDSSPGSHLATLTSSFCPPWTIMERGYQGWGIFFSAKDHLDFQIVIREIST